jgi:hypothetical protein
MYTKRVFPIKCTCENSGVKVDIVSNFSLLSIEPDYRRVIIRCTVCDKIIEQHIIKE